MGIKIHNFAIYISSDYMYIMRQTVPFILLLDTSMAVRFAFSNISSTLNCLAAFFPVHSTKCDSLVGTGYYKLYIVNSWKHSFPVLLPLNGVCLLFCRSPDPVPQKIKWFGYKKILSPEQDLAKTMLRDFAQFWDWCSDKWLRFFNLDLSVSGCIWFVILQFYSM